MMLKRSVLCFLLVVLYAPHSAHGRWAVLDDADAIYESLRTEFDVSSDGTYTKLQDATIAILKEDGRKYSNYRRVYNPRASSFEVLEAETINGAESTKVDSAFIEDKPQASRLTGFDDSNLVTIAFPKITIGSKLHIKTKELVKEIPIPGHFSNRFFFGDDFYEKQSIVVIHSELPLKYEVNDPNKQLHVESKTDGKKYVLKITVVKPIYVRVLEEAAATVFAESVPWVAVSTANDYASIANTLAPAYENIIAQKLPKTFEHIVMTAQKLKLPVEQINEVTAQLAEHVRYMGDWRPIRGGHVPRALDVIAETRFGDCKDFTVATAAILRTLGFKTNAVWVERAHLPKRLPQVAVVSAFDHAVVRAERDGKVFWIDPTNFVSFAQGIFADIINRQALVLEPGRSRIEQIPNERAQDAVDGLVSHFRLHENGNAKVNAKLKFSGRQTHWLTGARLKRSDTQVAQLLVSMLTDESRVLWKKWNVVGARGGRTGDLTSRIVGDLHLGVDYIEKNIILRTTVGPAFYLNQRLANPILRIEPDTRVSDLFLGPPTLAQTVDVVERMRIVGSTPPVCEIDSPWLKISRQVAQAQEGVKIVDSREIKQGRISNSELKTTRFLAFQKKVRECFDRVAIIVESSNTKRK